MDHLSAQGVNQRIVFSFRVSDNDIILSNKKRVGDLSFGSKGFTDPGVPRIRPFGFFSFSGPP